MTTKKKPTAPAGLATRGSRFWRTTAATYELSETESELLLECCRLLDECESLRTAVDVDGVTVAGSTGQPRVNPALGELRQHRLALGKLFSQLSLPDEEDGTLRSPMQARSGKAAQARWGAHNAAKAARTVEMGHGSA